MKQIDIDLAMLSTHVLTMDPQYLNVEEKCFVRH
jgi:hypothetical protein